MQSLREFSNKLLKLYTGDFAGINLTRILDSDDFYNKQIIDSLIPFQEMKSVRNLVDQNELIVDIGFGGGFPLLPMAHILPDNIVLGLEARGKKAKVVQEIADKSGLSNVTTFHKRSEDIYIDIPCLVTFKAVGKIDLCLSQLHCCDGVSVLFYKGPDFENEERELKLDKSWSVEEKKFFELPHGEKRTIVILKKNVPRGTMNTGQIKTKSKLSELLVNTER